MAPLAYILIGVGTYLLTKEVVKPKEGQTDEQDVSDVRRRGRTARSDSDRAGESRSGRNRNRGVSKPRKSTLNTGEHDGLQTTGDLHRGESGDDSGGEQFPASGDGEAESVTDNPDTEQETGDNDEREDSSDDRGRDRSGNVRGESSGSGESASPETSQG